MPSIPPDLRAALRLHQGVVTSADLRALGVGRSVLDRLLIEGVLVRVARGAFVDGEQLRDATPDRLHVLRTVAIARAWPDGIAVSHDSAALLLGLPVLATPDRVRGTLLRSGSHRSQRGVSIHAAGLVHPVERVLGCSVAHAADVALGVACLHGTTAAVVVIDAALHRHATSVRDPGRPRVAGAASREDLETVVRARRHRPGMAALRAAVRAADPACESPGETRTRLLLRQLGYAVRSQVEVHDPIGRLIGRADLALEGERVLVEFDGAVKYQRHGQTAAGDKRRDMAMQDAGYEVVRLMWRHLDQPDAVRAMVEHARARARR